MAADICDDVSFRLEMNVLLMLVNAPKEARTTRATIRPYSMAVDPVSFK